MPFLSRVIIEHELLPLRLDRYVSEVLNLFSRSQIKIRNLKAKLNGKDVKLSKTVKKDDAIELSWEEPPPLKIIPEDIPLEIIYEDNRCIVVNKAQGMVVHPGAGNRQGTLANALLYKKINMGCETSCGVRPGIVHRLDKDTSGIMIAAFDDETHKFLADQFKSRKVQKTYIAIVHGMPKENKGRIETCITRDSASRKRFTVSVSGKNSITYYKVIKTWRNYSLVMLRPRTGRTHQLRVHMLFLGNPILGDPVYGKIDSNFPDASLMLHSKSLVITLAGEMEERLFSSALPSRFFTIIEKLDRINNNG